MQTYNVSRLPSMIKIGYDGENNWRPQAFDCTPLLQNHPNGTISLWLLPHGETQAFPVALTRDGNSVIWTPLSEEMTAAAGALQLVCTDGTDVGKSAVVMFRVDESILPGADHPAAVPSWATQTIERAEAAADRAEEAAKSIDPEQIEQTIQTAVEAYLDEHPIDAPVTSVNGKTGAVVLNATDIGALPADTPIPAAVTVDSALSETSENPVQNKVVKAALGGKVDKVTGHGLVSTRNVTNGYELGITDGISVTNIPVVGISSYNTAMQQASQALAAKADASSVYTKTEIDNKGYQTATDVRTAIEPFVIPITGNEDNWTTTASAADIVDHADNCVMNVYGSNYAPQAVTKYEQTANIQTVLCVIQYGMLFSQNIAVYADKSNNSITISVEPASVNLLPAVTASDNGKFLRVVSGAWAAQAVPSAENNSFGGGA